MDFPALFQALKEILPIMAAAGVAGFRCGELEISFNHGGQSPEGATLTPAVDAANPVPPDAPIGIEKTEGVVAPQSLDEEIPYDKILNWSSPTDDGPVPLTDDAVPPPLPAEASDE